MPKDPSSLYWKDVFVKGKIEKIYFNYGRCSDRILNVVISDKNNDTTIFRKSFQTSSLPNPNEDDYRLIFLDFMDILFSMD